MRKPEVLAIVQNFKESIVSEVEKSLGNYEQIQQAFKTADRKKKNALWSAVRHQEPDLLEKILAMVPPSSDQPDTSCIITIGPPRSGKTAYVQEHFASHHRIDLREFHPLTANLSLPGHFMKDLGLLISRHLE